MKSRAEWADAPTKYLINVHEENCKFIGKNKKFATHNLWEFLSKKNWKTKDTILVRPKLDENGMLWCDVTKFLSLIIIKLARRGIYAHIKRKFYSYLIYNF